MNFEGSCFAVIYGSLVRILRFPWCKRIWAVRIDVYVPGSIVALKKLTVSTGFKNEYFIRIQALRVNFLVLWLSTCGVAETRKRIHVVHLPAKRPKILLSLVVLILVRCFVYLLCHLVNLYFFSLFLFFFKKKLLSSSLFGDPVIAPIFSLIWRLRFKILDHSKEHQSLSLSDLLLFPSWLFRLWLWGPLN